MGKPMKLGGGGDAQKAAVRPAPAPSTINTTESVEELDSVNYDEAEIPLPPVATFENPGGGQRRPFRVK